MVVEAHRQKFGGAAQMLEGGAGVRSEKEKERGRQNLAQQAQSACEKAAKKEGEEEAEEEAGEVTNEIARDAAAAGVRRDSGDSHRDEARTRTEWCGIGLVQSRNSISNISIA